MCTGCHGDRGRLTYGTVAITSRRVPRRSPVRDGPSIAVFDELHVDARRVPPGHLLVVSVGPRSRTGEHLANGSSKGGGRPIGLVMGKCGA